MNSLTGFIERKVAPPLIKFASLRYIQVIQRNGLGIMSLLVIGSIFLLIASFPVPAYLEFLGDFRLKIAAASGVGTAFIALLTVMTTSFATIEWYNKNQNANMDVLPPMVLAVASFMLLNPAQALNTIVEGVKEPVPFTGVSAAYLGAAGVFAAIIIAIVTVEIYRFLFIKKITIKFPENVPPMVSSAFSALIPSAIVIIIWWLFGTVLELNLPEIIANLFKPLVAVGDTPFAMFMATLVNRALWSVGIHGGNIVGGVASSGWLQMVASNQTAMQAGEALPYTYTSIFQDVYIMTGLAPLSLALIIARAKRFKTLGALSIAPSLFNIGEPLIFGLPIMLNPLMMIPFVLSPILMNALAIVGVNLNILPVPVLSAPWITPAPIKAFIATGGSIPAVIFVLLGWVITFFLYYPFVVSLDRSETSMEKEMLAEAAANEKAIEKTKAEMKEQYRKLNKK